MGKCSWLITKGSKKGHKCSIYSKKKHNEKYYCASHYKMVKEDEKNQSEELSEDHYELVSEGSLEYEEEKPIVKKKTKKKPKEEKLTLESHSMDDIIEQEFKQVKNKEKSKSDIEMLKEKIEYLINRMNDLFPPNNPNNNIENNYELPEMETWQK